MMIKKRITQGAHTFFLRYNPETSLAALACSGVKDGLARELLERFPLTPVREQSLVVPSKLKRHDRLQEVRAPDGDTILAFFHKYGNGKWFAYFTSPPFKMLPWLDEMEQIGYSVEDIHSFGRVFT